MKYWLPTYSTLETDSHSTNEDPNEIDEGQQATLSKLITRSSHLPNNKVINNKVHFFELPSVQRVLKWDCEIIW